MYILNSIPSVKPQEDCPCGDPTEVMEKIDKKLACDAEAYLQAALYGSNSGFNIDDASLLLTLRRAYLMSSKTCSTCLGLRLEDICSKILRQIYK